jgi:hypothetical protein
MSGSKKRKLDPMVAIVVVAVAGLATYGGLSVYRSHAAATATAQPPALTASAAAQHLRITLDPNQLVGEVKEAYLIAESDPALLAQLHCWCGCDRTDGHKNLLDCYRDTHGAHCSICTGEAIEAEKLAAQGMPVEKIRDALRDRFANGD